ncbi:MAG: adenosine kinase [Sclerophora amabilis]|nr:MAG: adenosine kinase [Sclerophora amabilis]
MSTSQDYPLLCLENPLLDIQGQGDEKLLEKYGLKANDAILAEEKHMGLYDDLIDNHSAKLIAGGAAQNVARGAQYILPPKSSVYIGGVGRDKSASILQDQANKEGLRTEYRVDDKHPTGRCGVIITGHDRSMCTDLAAANHYTLDHLKQPEIWKLVEQARVYFVGGYHLTVCVPAIMALAEHAAANNKIFVLCLSAPFIPQFFKEPLDQTAPYWDYVVGNETEALAYAESHDLNTKSIQEIASHIALLPKANAARPRTVIITQGTDPTIVAVSPASPADDSKPIITEFPVHAIDKSQINDTNGAGWVDSYINSTLASDLHSHCLLLVSSRSIILGVFKRPPTDTMSLSDAFAGGLVAGIVKGVSLETAVDMGQWLAKLSIQELGPS